MPAVLSLMGQFTEWLHKRKQGQQIEPGHLPNTENLD
jgi:hypothetical protein